MVWSVKKKSISILLLFLWVATPALCQEFLLAKVLAIDSARLELTISTPAAPNTQITVRITEENDLPRDGKQLFLPKCVVPGATIRLWGSRGPAEESLFIATSIRGCKNGGCADPTGVRSRLRKMWKHTNEVPDHDGSVSRRSGYGNHGGGGQGNGGGGNGGGGGGGK